MNAPGQLPAGFSRTMRLREMLQSNRLEFMMEAHNGLSARIVKEAGFKAIWGSGLAISAQFGVRDNNEASWTQVVDMLEFMADASDLPILLDGDTGYGNFNNVRRLVRKLEQRGIAGVCIEDKQFPKTNSFINGEAQPLADIDEFCGKIKAGKDSQSDPNFSIVARVEALIAGWGMEEALRRAEAYRQAGADAILIHSKLSKPDEILTFAREWAGRGPLVIVPTKYYSTPTDVVPSGGHQHRDLGEPSDPRRDFRDAGDREGDPRKRDARERGRPHRDGQRDFPPAGRRRIFGGRERVPVGVERGAQRGRAGGEPWRGPRSGDRRPSEGHAADRRQAAAAASRRGVQEGRHQRHHGRRRLSRGRDRYVGHPARRQRAARRRRASLRRWHARRSRSPATP